MLRGFFYSGHFEKLYFHQKELLNELAGCFAQQCGICPYFSRWDSSILFDILHLLGWRYGYLLVRNDRNHSRWSTKMEPSVRNKYHEYPRYSPMKRNCIHWLWGILDSIYIRCSTWFESHAMLFEVKVCWTKGNLHLLCIMPYKPRGVYARWKAVFWQTSNTVWYGIAML